MFLMLFYNQVLGVPPAVVSAVLMITLVFDAIFDPLIGQASDNFRSRWGRRHPFMYAAAVPFPLLFFLLWNPPGMADAALPVFLLVVLIGVRFFDTFYELPAAALAPELAENYAERTQLAAIRAFFGMTATLGMSTLALNVFLKENPDGTGGVLSRDGYFNYSLAAALTIFGAILICSAGTHRVIPRLSRAPARKLSFRGMAQEVAQTLNNRSFLAIALAGMLAGAGNGLAGALEMYWNLYFFRLSQHQIVLLAAAGAIASILGTALVTRLCIWFGKRGAAVGLFLTALVGTLTPLTLRLLGVLDDPDRLFALLLPSTALATASTIAAMVTLTAMMMDVVEQAELRTGRRSEGLLFSAENLVKKMTSGVGVFGSGLLLAVVSFPTGAERHQVAEPVLAAMALYFIPLKAVLIGGSVISLMFYGIDRAEHEENLRKLRSADTAG